MPTTTCVSGQVEAGMRVLAAGGRKRGTGHLARGRGATLKIRRSAGQRRVIVKVRTVRQFGTTFRAAPLARHIAYLERDGVTREGGDARMFDAESDLADAEKFAERCDGDR